MWALTRQQLEGQAALTPTRTCEVRVTTPHTRDPPATRSRRPNGLIASGPIERIIGCPSAVATLRGVASLPRSVVPSQYAACPAFRQPVRRYSPDRCWRTVVSLMPSSWAAAATEPTRM